ncbi:hypothetical protein D3C86_2182630 [compost metagenome]
MVPSVRLVGAIMVVIKWLYRAVRVSPWYDCPDWNSSAYMAYVGLARKNIANKNRMVDVASEAVASLRARRSCIA